MIDILYAAVLVSLLHCLRGRGELVDIRYYNMAGNPIRQPVMIFGWWAKLHRWMFYSCIFLIAFTVSRDWLYSVAWVIIVAFWMAEKHDFDQDFWWWFFRGCRILIGVICTVVWPLMTEVMLLPFIQATTYGYGMFDKTRDDWVQKAEAVMGLAVGAVIGVGCL